MVRVIKLLSDMHVTGNLVVLESSTDFAKSIQRVFVVAGKQAATRGKHAHKKLTQILVCLHGVCKVTCDDGSKKKEIVLDKSDIALEIPPGIWAEQYYAEPDTILMVVCDNTYEESDYIRNYDEFLAYKKKLTE